MKLVYHDKRRRLYLARAENGLVKIGVSIKPEYRMRSIATISPIEVSPIGYWKLPDAQETETLLHRHYKDCRVKNEWFRFEQHDLLRLIEWLSEVGERMDNRAKNYPSDGMPERLG